MVPGVSGIVAFIDVFGTLCTNCIFLYSSGGKIVLAFITMKLCLK